MASVTVLQLSDTHFLEDGVAPEGGFGYDIAAAFEAVRADIGDGTGVDLIAVTGDVADHGTPGQYRLAASAFSQLPRPVNVCPGNHDADLAFATHMGRPSVSTSRVVEAGAWAMVFLDSCAGLLRPDHRGVLVDPDGEERLHSNGSLAASEAEFLRDVVSTTDAEHVFIWLHHPPVQLPIYGESDYRDAWAALLGELNAVDGAAKIRGFGAGHTHVPTEHELDGVPVFVAPSLKNNFDLEAGTWLPPGYRSYEFADDGTITSEVQLVGEDRWPRRPMGRAVRALFAGEITFAELDEIVRLKAAGTQGNA